MSAMRRPGTAPNLSGDPASGSCEVTFYAAGRKLAVATLGRDLDSLQAEVAFEKAMAAL